MNNGTWTKIQLASGDLWNDRGRSRPLTVTCENGTVWLTHEREGRDIILTAGTRFVIAQDGLAVVQSLTDALIVVADGSGEQEALNPHITMIASNNTWNNEPEQKRNNRRSVMKKVTRAMVATLGLTWAAMSWGAVVSAPPAAAARIETAAGYTAPHTVTVAAEWANPYDEGDAEQISLWLGVGISVLMLAYFVVVVIEDREPRAEPTIKQPFVCAAIVSKVQDRKPFFPVRIRVVWDEAGHVAKGVN